MSTARKAAVDPVLFRTANLNFAAYLVASEWLTLDHVEGHAKFSEFYFVDPDNAGQDIAREFATKDLKASARLLLETRAALLNEIRRSAEGHR